MQSADQGNCAKYLHNAFLPLFRPIQFRLVVVSTMPKVKNTGKTTVHDWSGQASFFAPMASKLHDDMVNFFVSVAIFCQFNSFSK